MEPVANRGRRAVVLMGLAAAAAAVAGVGYLRPAPAPAMPPPPARPTGSSRHLVHASFGDAQHGAVSLSDRGLVATFLTADGGRTWRRLASRPGVTTFLDRDHVVAVGLDAGGTFGVSDDGGRTWRTVPQPVQLFAAPLAIREGVLLGGPFFLGPADGWWFGSRSGTAGHALYRTANGGRTWIDLVPSGIPVAGRGPLQAAFVDRLRGALAVASGGPDAWPSLFVTRDGGETWAPVSPRWPPAGVPPGQGSIVAPALLAHGDRLVLALDLVVDRSSGPSALLGHALSTSADGGLTWGPWTAMPSTSTATGTMAFDDAGSLLMADGRRLLSSADLGSTWRSRPLNGLAGRLSAVISARGGAAFAIAVSGPVGAATSTLLRSLDGGASWTEVPLPTARLA